VESIRPLAEDVQDEVDLAGRFLFEAHRRLFFNTKAIWQAKVFSVSQK
jgi:hypothetical protein